MMPPTAAVVAAPAPVIAAKIILATTSTTAGPPGIQPTSFLAKSTILREMPPLCIKQPAITKKGMAIRVKRVHTLEHLLSNDNQGDIRIEYQIQNCGMRTAQWQWNPQEQQDEESNNQYCQIHFLTSQISSFICDFICGAG